jgi:FkbM family methyltransferase
MIDLTNYDWGPFNEIGKQISIDEAQRGVYENFYTVNENDIVVDIGASVGIFTYSILHKRPKHVFCLEPSKTEFPYLVKNTIGYPVTQINKAISTGDGMTNDTSADIYFYDGLFETITFKSFLELYNINHINFLKTDCEGGEYDIFTEENIDFLKNNVDHIVGEWHLSNHIQKAKFRHFRDNYLKKFKNVNVISVDGIDIKWDLWNDHFIEYYKQVMIHISNK